MTGSPYSGELSETDGWLSRVTPTAQPSFGETIEMLFKIKWVRSIGVPLLPRSFGWEPGRRKMMAASRMMISAAASAEKLARKRRFLCGNAAAGAGGAKGAVESVRLIRLRIISSLENG